MESAVSMYSEHTEKVKARLEAQTICVKSVPDAEPNATGVWRKVVAELKHLDPRKFGDGKHTDMWDALSELLPDGFHAVAVQSDLRFADKPGNWFPNARP